MNEIFIGGKPYKKWDDNYYISAYGDVYSVKRDLILHPYVRRNHYCVFLYGKHRLVHRLTYETWVGSIPDGLLVLHKDDDKNNNHVSNLYLGTEADNMRDRVINGHFSNGRSSSKQVTVKNRINGEQITFPSKVALQKDLGYSQWPMDRLINTDRFKERYELLDYSNPHKSAKERIDSRKPIILKDKERDEILNFGSLKDFLNSIDRSRYQSLPSLQTHKWFRDRYEIISYGNEVSSE